MINEAYAKVSATCKISVRQWVDKGGEAAFLLAPPTLENDDGIVKVATAAPPSSLE